MGMTIAPRLHVLLARRALIGLIIRRGPSRHVCTIGWNRGDDTFTLGQWLTGRIYERRCDLSPDGRHVIYFAMNGKWDSEAKGSWTAVSRVPYLKAVGLWPKGDCWNGGGLFVDDRTVWLNDGRSHEELIAPDGLCTTDSDPRDNPSFVSPRPGPRRDSVARFRGTALDQRRLWGRSSAPGLSMARWAASVR